MEDEIKSRLLSNLRRRYRRASKKQKGTLLTEVENLFCVGRRQAGRLLSCREAGRPAKSNRGRPSQYGDVGFKRALQLVWKQTYFMCSKHLKAAMAEWLPYIKAAYPASFTDDIEKRLLKVSSATIDRILKPCKANKGKSLTNPGGFRDEIPIQTNIWNVTKPGFIEADTVAHCGKTTEGQFLWSVTTVDIATIWHEARAIHGKGSYSVVKAIESIEDSLPFQLCGYDSDNGTELLNKHMLNYFTKERTQRGRPAVQVTRCRPYHKNDQAHIEQRNDSLARRWIGYERIEFEQLEPLVTYYYAFIVCPLTNHFFPTHKLHEKRQIRSRTRRIYKNPVTPYNRVLASEHVPAEQKAVLETLHHALNPLELRKQERLIRAQIDRAIKAANAGCLTERLVEVPDTPDCFVRYVEDIREAKKKGLSQHLFPSSLPLRQKP